MNEVDARDLLRSVPLFARLDAAACDATLACVRWRSLAPGEALFHLGDPGDSMVLVATGELAVEIAQTGGTSREIARVGPGEVLGEMACIDPGTRSATVIAVAPSTVCELTRGALTRLGDAAPAVASMVVASVIRDVSRRLRDVDAQIEHELARSAEGRASQGPGRASAPPPARASQLPARPSQLPRASAAPPRPSAPPAEGERSSFWRLLDRLRGSG